MNWKIKYAKKLRKNSTDTEDSLWYFLRSKRLGGYKFRRQHPIGNYIVDFVCLEKKLIIELDGGQHLVTNEKDNSRDNGLRQEGFQIIRFLNNEFLENKDEVLEKIMCLLQEALSP